MDGIVNADGGRPAALSAPDGWPADGEGSSPFLTLEGFSGPLDHLLTLARSQKIDLCSISLTALVDQLTRSLRQASGQIPLGQQGDWVVMAAWLVQLRARLLLPADAPEQQDAAAQAGEFRERLVALQEMQAVAGWLARRPQLGHDVFARGRPEVFGISVDPGHAVDVIEFLWASLALFDDEPVPQTATLHRPLHLELYVVADARERILRRLAETPEGAPFERFLPDPPVIAAGEVLDPLRRRSAWSSTLIASLELAKQGEVVLGQGDDFQSIYVAPA